MASLLEGLLLRRLESMLIRLALACDNPIFVRSTEEGRSMFRGFESEMIGNTSISSYFAFSLEVTLL